MRWLWRRNPQPIDSDSLNKISTAIANRRNFFIVAMRANEQRVVWDFARFARNSFGERPPLCSLC